MARGGQRGYGNAGRSAYAGGNRGAQSRAVLIAAGAPPLIDPLRFMFWATRARVASGDLVTAATGTNYVMTRIVVANKRHAVTGPRFHYSGFASTEAGSAPQETVLPVNSVVIDGVWISVAGAPAVPLTFAGTAGVTIASGDLGAWTDEPSVTIPANAPVAIYTLSHTAIGEKQIPVYRIQTHRGERIWGAGDAASLLPMLATPGTASTASLMTGYGQTQPQYYGPDLTVARGWDGKPVALVSADSIGEARQEFAIEADARGNLGWLRRWLDTADPTNGRIPHYVIGMPGASSVRELTGSGSTIATKRWDVLDQVALFNAGGALPFTVLVNQLAQNDLQTGYSTMEANYRGFLDRFIARYPSITKRVATGVLPRTASTDNYTTRINQTPSTGNEWANGATPWGAGNKWLLEAYKQAGAGARLTGYIDTRPYWLDTAPTSGKSPATWPAPSQTTTLTSQAGTDGTAAYTSIQVADPLPVGGILRLNGTQAFNVSRIAGTGPYTVYDDGATARVTVIPNGSPAYLVTTVDGVHGYAPAPDAMAAAIGQAAKALL